MYHRSPQLCKATGLTYRIVDYWSRVGVLTASGAEGAGSGSQRLWTDEDVEIARVLNRLRLLDMPTGTLRTVGEHLRDAHPQVWPERALIDRYGTFHPPTADVDGWLISVRPNRAIKAA